MPGSDQIPAQIRDVGLGASSRRINPLKVQGQVHGFQSPRSYPEPGVPEAGMPTGMSGSSMIYKGLDPLHHFVLSLFEAFVPAGFPAVVAVCL